MNEKFAIIAGAGPAGLTAAYELLKQTDVKPIVLEASNKIGGIAQTINYKGNRMDIGGHRFFSKNAAIMKWWTDMMPIQGSPSKDDLLLGLNDKRLSSHGPNPESDDRVMLLRHRVSRIFFLRKFFDYPISMKKETFLNMGLLRTIQAGMGYVWSCLHKLPETSLENFYINRFGRPLYNMFFEGYTEKVWGVHPSHLGADWGSQRVKGLSIKEVLKDMIRKSMGRKSNDNAQTSLIEEFIYPKYGPGQLWEITASEIAKAGGEVRLDSKVTKVVVADGNVKSVVVTESDGHEYEVSCDYFISSMPIKDLVCSIHGMDVPADVHRIATSLPYRDFITVGVCVKEMSIKNGTRLKTYKERIPDTWIYIQERDVKIGRLQIFNNWSPYLVNHYEDSMWIGLEYFCTEGDELWNKSAEDFIAMAIDELVKIDVIEKDAVLDACHAKIRKAYPAYYGSYYELNAVKNWLDAIPNLFCVGRNGQHRYNNMDHSMLTAMECVKNIQAGQLQDKVNVWNVNTESEYHESN